MLKLHWDMGTNVPIKVTQKVNFIFGLHSWIRDMRIVDVVVCQLGSGRLLELIIINYNMYGLICNKYII
jgi:hypothetical protein